MKCYDRSSVAQLLAHLHMVPKVSGSNLRAGQMYFSFTMTLSHGLGRWLTLSKPQLELDLWL